MIFLIQGLDKKNTRKKTPSEDHITNHAKIIDWNDSTNFFAIPKVK